MFSARGVITILMALIIVLTIASHTMADVRVIISDSPEEWSLVFLLFDTPDTLGDLREPIRTWVFPADGRSEYVLQDVPGGLYVLVVFHDINSNGQLDRNLFGIPTEPVGFSNAYRPKGSPTFHKAAVTIPEHGTQSLAIELYKPLGRRGRMGVGLGLLGRSSPYREYRGEVYQAIPALTFVGSRFQVLGPAIQVSLHHSNSLDVAAAARYRMGVYQEKDSLFLSGMGDRESTVMMGFVLKYRIAGGLKFQARYDYDLLGRLNGGEASLTIQKSFHLGPLRFSPEIGINWISSELSRHDFGVEPDQAREDRPVYHPGNTLTSEAGVGIYFELTRNWRLVLSGTAEFLSTDITQSPLVNKNRVYKGFAAINYVF